MIYHNKVTINTDNNANAPVLADVIKSSFSDIFPIFLNTVLLIAKNSH